MQRSLNRNGYAVPRTRLGTGCRGLVLSQPYKLAQVQFPKFIDFIGKMR